MVHFGNDWDTILDGEFAKTYYQNLRQFLLTEYRTQTVYPGMYDIFNALKYTPYAKVRAVILGQDPYHGPNQGARTELFRAERRSAAAVSGEHFQGDQGRCGHRQHRQARRADQLGKARGTAAEHGADRPCRTGEFPQRQRLGTVHR